MSASLVLQFRRDPSHPPPPPPHHHHHRGESMAHNVRTHAVRHPDPGARIAVYHTDAPAANVPQSPTTTLTIRVDVQCSSPVHEADWTAARMVYGAPQGSPCPEWSKSSMTKLPRDDSEDSYEVPDRTARTNLHGRQRQTPIDSTKTGHEHWTSMADDGRAHCRSRARMPLIQGKSHSDPGRDVHCGQSPLALLHYCVCTFLDSLTSRPQR